jgi:hypothetical protein
MTPEQREQARADNQAVTRWVRKIQTIALRNIVPISCKVWLR